MHLIYRYPNPVRHLVASSDDDNACAEPATVDMSQVEDINTVAGLLKMYLRELPQPLLPYELYSRFINAASG